ncbi:MFS transporter [Nonomuraea sp. MCN248]|uniref:MFS transporter n=1 Tax=Nonomuraea corallina TaxID=2989783 RepID=A0ABT4S8J4_9ACTN|nr:MFS transporter [Nonomuraea corallina]MDA0633489.1 MFS transporter [Nonomuraea corallina]
MTATGISAPPSAASADRFTGPQKIALALLLTANFTLAVDFSILNVALPHIGRDLDFATAALQWIVTSFALCAAGFTLFFGRVADLFGRKRLFLAGIVLLGVSSLAGGLAQDPALMLAARAGQGVATAMVTPAALSLMTTMLPEGPARSRALGLNGALMAAGFTTGAVLGGVLTGTVSWRWAFFINVVIAVAVIAVAPFVLREPPAGRRPRLDAPGAVTVTLALVALVLGIDTAGHAGWTHAGAWGPILAATVLFVIFWRVESRIAEPLIAPALLKRRTVAWGNLAGLLAFATETSLVFLLTLYLQEVLGYTAVTAGLILAVLGIGTVLGGLIAPRVIGRTGARTAIVVGFVVQAAATLPLAFVGDDRGWLVPLLVVTFLGGVANLVAIVGYTVMSTAGVPSEQQGLATGLVTMSQQVGITLGTPVMSALVTGWAATTLLPGLRFAIGVNAGIAVVAALLVACFLRVPKPPA